LISYQNLLTALDI